MIYLASGTSSPSNADSYFAIALLITLGAGIFLDPDKGRFYKWLYWVIVPLLVIVLLSIGTGSIAAGLALGSILIVILAVGYFRYRYDKK
ncbi:hypothetical protein ABIA30_002668 [Mycobacterium sp. MAA66]|jgi:hypothetical protein|uniref:hypothetical protein n=1 Tax=Mycobacterium sp. MAA66 TaxID=3156297 RepID=UPI0035114674